jgi:hypothetical protein
MNADSIGRASTLKQIKQLDPTNSTDYTTLSEKYSWIGSLIGRYKGIFFVNSITCVLDSVSTGANYKAFAIPSAYFTGTASSDLDQRTIVYPYFDKKLTIKLTRLFKSVSLYRFVIYIC